MKDPTGLGDFVRKILSMATDTNRPRKITLKSGVTIEIFRSPHIEAWVGICYLGKPVQEYDPENTVISYSKARAVRMLRLPIAKLENPAIKSVHRKMIPLEQRQFEKTIKLAQGYGMGKTKIQNMIIDEWGEEIHGKLWKPKR